MASLQLRGELLDLVLTKQKDNGLFQMARQRKDARLVMVMAAEAMVGIKEATGRNDGKYIEMIQDTFGSYAREPYCVAGVLTCGMVAQELTGKDFLLYPTESSRTMWHETINRRPDLKVRWIPLPGAVAIWADLPLSKWTGHAEIVRAADDKIFYNVGFNTTGTLVPTKVGDRYVEREGNGVYYTVRDYKATEKRKLLGFLKPFA